MLSQVLHRIGVNFVSTWNAMVYLTDDWVDIAMLGLV